MESYRLRVMAEGCNRLGMRLLTMTQAGLEEELAWTRRNHEGMTARAGDAFEARVEDGWRFFGERADHARRQMEMIKEELWIAENRALRVVMAVKAFELSASLGDPEGMWNLGWRCCLGEGRDQSDEAARLWWDRAAANGHDEATSELAQRGWVRS